MGGDEKLVAILYSVDSFFRIRSEIMLSIALASTQSWSAPQLPGSVTSPKASTSGVDRRALLSGAFGAFAATALPQMASAKIESVNPANNYYFPMAKYRYLPRILRAWIAVDQLADAALEVGDWEGMEEVWRRADDAGTALPLYANAVEGSRSTKRKKKSDAQKQMNADTAIYRKEIKKLGIAIEKKDTKAAKAAIAAARPALLEYRQLAQIDTEDGGVVTIPLGNAEEAGHAGAPLGYVVPAFRGGGVSMDYALRDGEPMMKNGIITQEYRNKYQNAAGEEKKGKK